MYLPYPQTFHSSNNLRVRIYVGLLILRLIDFFPSERSNRNPQFKTQSYTTPRKNLQTLPLFPLLWQTPAVCRISVYTPL